MEGVELRAALVALAELPEEKAEAILVDVTDCPERGRRMKWMDACTVERDINRVLAKHGLAPRAPPLSPWISFDQLSFLF